jgi:hypothetical protein
MTEIYVERAPGDLVAVRPSAYETEDVLQHLVEQHPDLLAGRQMGGDEPRRWLLIGREVGVPIEADGPDWYWLDHLFIDQDAIPTLVEVKWSSDTRIRREVVGQMLDYAANAAAYWPVDRLRGADHLVGEKLGIDDPDTFWRRAEENLRSGRLRLVFLADEIPTGLQRIIEFLNENLTNAEVFGVSVALYEGDGIRAFVPRVVGQTARALAKPGTTDDRGFDDWLTDASPDFLRCLELLDGWATDNGLDIGTTKVNRKISVDRVTIVSASPRWDYVQPCLPVLLRSADGEALREKVRVTVSTTLGARSTADYPMLATTAVAEHWPEFRDQVLEPLRATALTQSLDFATYSRTDAAEA